jgi:cobalt-zinc-cadmium efflux system outer membrane protein
MNMHRMSMHRTKLHRRIPVTVAVFLFLLAPLVAPGQPTLDLRAVLSAADAANLELRVARQQRALALAGLTTARQLPNPTLGFTAARDTPHEGVSLDLPIELGGKRGKRIAIAQEEQRSTEIDIAVLGQQIRHRTREAFFRSLAARAQTLQAKAALDLSRRVHDLVQQRFEAGAVAQLEVLQAEVELARSTADYETTAELQRAADVTLAALLNRSISGTLPIDGRLDDVPQAASLETLTNEAMHTNADLQKSAQDLKTEERRLELAKTQKIPNLDLSVGADFNSPPDFQTGAKGGLAISIPLFYRGQGEVALSSARMELLRLTIASQQTSVSAQVASAYFDYVAKARQAQQYREPIVPQSARMEQMAEDSYQAGKSNVLTLLDAQRRLNEIQKAYLDALFAAQSSFATLEEAVGAPLD